MNIKIQGATKRLNYRNGPDFDCAMGVTSFFMSDTANVQTRYPMPFYKYLCHTSDLIAVFQVNNCFYHLAGLTSVILKRHRLVMS